MNSYVVYILECADGTLYVGSTTDVVKRVREHNESKRGAKYTRGRRPVVLRYTEVCDSLSAALIREVEIKRWRREDKLRLITEGIR